jgi:hypothetical protein
MGTRTEITIETERVFVVSQSRNQGMLWCHRCAATVPMLALDEAARIAGTTPQVIYRMAEAGQLHFGVAVGRVFICPTSLASEKAEAYSIAS